MPATMATLARDAALRFGDRTAVTFLEAGRDVTFREVNDLVARYAGGLAAMGIAPGDRVLIHLPNCLLWVIAYHAVARLGAVVVPANILLAPPEVGFLAADSGAKLAIVPFDRKDALAGAFAGAGCKMTTVVEGAVPGSTDWLLAERLHHGPATEPVDILPGDLFTIGYTSGTTGRPKGAMQSHGAVATSIAMTSTFHLRHSGDTVLSALPFPHVYGNVVMNSAFLTGLHLIVMERFDAARAIAAIDSERVTLFEGVPTMFYQMLAQPGIDAVSLGSLTRCTVGGQTIPVATIMEIERRFGCPLLELWGMTEVSGPAISHSPYWPSRPGTIGLPFPGTEVRLADLADATREAGPGEAGELLVRGLQVTHGYWNDPQSTDAARDANGWLATGDVAERDGDGYLRIVDRRKDLIITAGYNIYPAELEHVIAMHPAVSMVAVAPVADMVKGELAKAFVVLRAGAPCDAATLEAHCRKHLAAYKVPRVFAFVDDLPRTSTGKILRRALRADAAGVQALEESTTS